MTTTMGLLLNTCVIRYTMCYSIRELRALLTNQILRIYSQNIDCTSINVVPIYGIQHTNEWRGKEEKKGKEPEGKPEGRNSKQEQSSSKDIVKWEMAPKTGISSTISSNEKLLKLSYRRRFRFQFEIIRTRKGMTSTECPGNMQIAGYCIPPLQEKYGVTKNKQKYTKVPKKFEISLTPHT